MEAFTDHKAVRAWPLGRKLCKIEDRIREYLLSLRTRIMARSGGPARDRASSSQPWGNCDYLSLIPA